jgi:hypothetical protein
MEKQKLIDDIIQIVLQNADNVNESIIDYKLDELLANKALTIPVVSNCYAIFEQDAKLTQEEIEEDCRNIPN